MMSARAQRLTYLWTQPVVFAVLLTFTALNGTSGQTIFYSRGQNVAPAFEGWEENSDGTRNLVFGYLNRNLDEELDIPIGPDNSLEPGGPDQGQPTHFLPRRNRYTFRVKVQKDFGKKELVWTLTVHGKTERAYATLRPDYVIDRLLIMKDVGALGTKKKERENEAPVVRVEGDAHRTVKVGEPLALTAIATDDGIPSPAPVPSEYPPRRDAWGLRVAWFVYRGAGPVTFDPEQFKVYTDTRSNSPWTPGWVPPPVPADGRFPVRATFSEPGTFVLRVMAHDGGLASTQDVTVTVTR
jgi:hypothetical protein